MKVRGQLARLSSVFPQCGSQGSNSGHQDVLGSKCFCLLIHLTASSYFTSLTFLALWMYYLLNIQIPKIVLWCGICCQAIVTFQEDVLLEQYEKQNWSGKVDHLLSSWHMEHNDLSLNPQPDSIWQGWGCLGHEGYHSSVTNGLKVSVRLVSNSKRVIEEEPLAMCWTITFISFDNIVSRIFCLFLLTVKGMCMP